jgi:hypothetical protein
MHPSDRNSWLPALASPGTFSGATRLSDRTKAVTCQISCSSKTHQPGGISVPGTPWRMTKNKERSSEARCSLGRARFAPRPPLPSGPWHPAQLAANSRLPRSTSAALVYGFWLGISVGSSAWNRQSAQRTTPLKKLKDTNAHPTSLRRFVVVFFHNSGRNPGTLIPAPLEAGYNQ